MELELTFDLIFVADHREEIMKVLLPPDENSRGKELLTKNEITNPEGLFLSVVLFMLRQVVFVERVNLTTTILVILAI